MTFIANPDFSKYQVVASPLPDRDSRVFYRANERGVCYRAYTFQLAQETSAIREGGYVILVQHGGGREALRIANVYGIEAHWLTKLLEREQYAAMWALYETATETRRNAAQETANRYCAAFAEGRLKKRRKNRRVYVEIEQPATPAQEVA